MAKTPALSDLNRSANLDSRGFLRFSAEAFQSLRLSQFSLVDLFVDPVGKRIALKLTKKEKPGSFRLLEFHGRPMVYIKGAMSHVKLSLKTQEHILQEEAGMLVLSGRSTKTGAWQFFPCRNSASIPMASIDHRGTLILDRHSTKALDIPRNSSATATYDTRKKELSLQVSPAQGELNIRAVGSHANISLMGTLSSLGLVRPKNRIRLACTIQGNQVRFSTVDLQPTRV